jgi:hypothetical protein
MATVFPAKDRFVIDAAGLRADFETFAAVLRARTSVRVTDFELIRKGQGNIFRLDSSSGSYALNILFVPGYPRKKQFEFVYGLLDENSIEHPRLEYFDESPELFPYGFMVHSWTPGLDAEHQGTDWLDSLIDALAPLHKVPADAFWSSTGFRYQSLKSYMTHVFDEIEHSFGDGLLKPCRIVGREAAGIVQAGELEALRSLIGKLSDLITEELGDVQPCLLHGDPLPGNLIIRDEENPSWIDWSESRMGWWPFDLARLLYYYKDARIFERFIQKKAQGTGINAIARYVAFEHVRQDLRQLFLIGFRNYNDSSELQGPAQVILKRIHKRLDIVLGRGIDYEKLISL